MTDNTEPMHEQAHLQAGVDIMDDWHCDFFGNFESFEKAIEELQRLSKIPWDTEPNCAPCMSWRTCGRLYVIEERGAGGSTEVLEVSANGVVWKEGFERFALG